MAKILEQLKESREAYIFFWQFNVSNLPSSKYSPKLDYEILDAKIWIFLESFTYSKIDSHKDWSPLQIKLYPSEMMFIFAESNMKFKQYVLILCQQSYHNAKINNYLLYQFYYIYIMKRKQFLNHLMKISDSQEYNISNKDNFNFLQPEISHHFNLKEAQAQSNSPDKVDHHCLEMMKKEILILEDRRHFIKWANQLKLKRISQKRTFSRLKFINKDKALKPFIGQSGDHEEENTIIENQSKDRMQGMPCIQQKHINYSGASSNYLSIREIQPQVQSFKRQPLKRSYYRPKVLGSEGNRRKSMTQPSQNIVQNKFNTSRVLWLNNHQQSNTKNTNIIASNKKNDKQYNNDKSQKKYNEKYEKIHTKKNIYKHYNRQYVPPPKITAKSYIIYEVKQKPLKSKAIASHQSKNSQEVASLTKIMTCILVIQICKEFCIDKYAEEVTIGTMQSSVGGTTASLQIGQIYNIQQLLYGLMLPSGNDASVALAVWAGRKLLQRQKESEDKYTLKMKQNMMDVNRQQNSQSCLSTNNSNKIKNEKKIQCYARFITQMNIKAKSLQMVKTNYANSHGLMNQKNRSSAYDIAILCQYAMKNQCFRQIVHSRFYKDTIKVNDQYNDTQYQANSQIEDSTKNIFKQAIKRQPQNKKEFKYKQKKQRIVSIEWENTHKLMHLRPKQYLGIKTGFTNAAGPCLASYISINNRHFIIIVLGCYRMNLRFKETQMLKKWLQKQQNLCKKKKKKQGNQHEFEKNDDSEVFQRQEQIEQQRAQIILKQLNADDQIQD